MDARARWWLIPLGWFWSLCHGFWFIGAGYGLLATVAIALGRRASVPQLTRLGATAVGAVLVVLLNHIGVGVFEEPFRVSDTSRFIAEWQRPAITDGPALALTVMAVVVASIWLFRRSEVTWFMLGLLASALVWTWYAERTIVLAAILVTPLLAAALQSVMPENEVSRPGTDFPTRRSDRCERVGILGAVAALALLAALVAPRIADRPGDVPTGLDPVLDRLPAGTPVFNAYALGGWIAWRHPDLDQFIDGLITPYSVAHVEAYHRTQVLDPGWYDVVRRSRAPVALLESDSALAAALERRGWTRGGTDAGYVLLERPERAAGR